MTRHAVVNCDWPSTVAGRCKRRPTLSSLACNSDSATASEDNESRVDRFERTVGMVVSAGALRTSAEGKEIVAYLKKVADENDITKNLRFKPTVKQADWSAEQRC